MLSWLNRLVGIKTATTISFSPTSIFVVDAAYVGVHTSDTVVQLYSYAEDLGEDLHKFFQFHKKGKDDEEAPMGPGLCIRSAPPYNLGDIVMNVFDNVIYTAGTAVGPHSVAIGVTSERAKVYTSTKTYIDE